VDNGQHHFIIGKEQALPSGDEKPEHPGTNMDVLSKIFKLKFCSGFGHRI